MCRHHFDVQTSSALRQVTAGSFDVFRSAFGTFELVSLRTSEAAKDGEKERSDDDGGEHDEQSDRLPLRRRAAHFGGGDGELVHTGGFETFAN